MRYVTGLYALNHRCSLNTTGDWHRAIWLKPEGAEYKESECSTFGNWGIEKFDDYCVADTLRAILDLLEKGSLRFLKGFKNDFICTDEYDEIFFEKVLLLRDSPLWDDIEMLMRTEFKGKWINFYRRIKENEQ